MEKFIVYCEENADEIDLQGLSQAIAESVQTNTPLAIELLFVDAEEIRSLNKQTRGVDSVTDVLSFPTLDGIKNKRIDGKEHPFDVDEDGNLLLGSIVICKERAKEQAEEYGHSLRRELAYLFVHGVMHCLGYDHMVDEEKAEMREKEEFVLKKMGITRE